MNQHDQMREIVQEIEGCFRNPDGSMKPMTLVPLGKVIRLQQALAAPAAPRTHVDGAAQALDKLLGQVINRRVAVEQKLFDMAAGKLLMPDADGLRKLAMELGDPAHNPPERAPLVRLTDDDVMDAYLESSLDVNARLDDLFDFANAIMDAMITKNKGAV